MKIGLIARADDRGLGTLTWEFHRNMNPERTLVVLTGDRDFPEHPERFTGNIFLDELGPLVGPYFSLDETLVRRFLDGLDVVYTAETFYDWRICDWAREMGVKTVVHGMPELTRHHREPLPKPDAWWWPTTWLTSSRIPEGPVVPIPCIYQPNLAAKPDAPGPLKVLHPGGKQALADRDGTETFIAAMSLVTEDIEVTVVTQDRVVAQPGWRCLGNVENRWDIYRGQHVTVLPRRYGGLSLKVQESLSVGVPVILPHIAPNDMWPGMRVPASPGRRIRVPYGPLHTWDSNPHAIAETIDELAYNRSLLAVDQFQAHEWAKRNTWMQLKPRYEQEFRALL